MVRMGSMVGCDAVYSAILKPGQQGLTITIGTQRRIHLEISVVIGHIFINQSEMMRRDFTGHMQAVALGIAYRLQRRSRGKMSNMKMAFGLSSQLNVPIHY